MNKRNQTVKFLFTSAASFAVASFLSACGGGDGSSPTGTVPNNDDHVNPSDGVVRFTRIGIDVLPALTRTGDLGGATMSATGAQVNFTYEDPVNQDSQYNFTFNTGFPGGAYAPGGMLQSPFVSITQGSTNSSVYISAPAQTQQLQNVFWTRANDPYTFGFGNTGYLLNPDSITWPASGMVTYTGTAMEYILNDVLTET